MAHLGKFKALALTALLLTAVPAGAQVGPNDIALGKTAFQSSDYDVNHRAGRAVDGNTDGNYYNLSSTHTNGDFQAWWYVDLGATYDISSITLWNRTDCCGYRLANFFVSVLASGTPNVSSSSAPAVWQSFFAGAMGTANTFMTAPNTMGQFVKVQLTGSDYLQLAEVDVQGLVVTATPEPSSILLLATGLGGLLAATRRRRTS